MVDWPRTVTVILLLCPYVTQAAIFQNAGVTVNDPNGDLSWKPANDALSIYCWFKISAPSGQTATQNMTILANGIDGSLSGPYAYLIQYNVGGRKVEFLSRGQTDNDSVTITLIDRPYTDRWYHVAVVREGDFFYSYVDGVERPAISKSIGDSGNVNGVSIGCLGTSNFFSGEIQEVAIFQKSITYMVNQLQFLDLKEEYHGYLGLRGYYRLSEEGRDKQFKNYAVNPPLGTASGQKSGAGTVSIVVADRAVEQSLFDAAKNGGENAIVPLSGVFAWEDTVLERPTKGIPFNFTYMYSSAIALSSRSGSAIMPNVMTTGWRHKFEMRMIPTQSSTERQILTADGAIETWVREGSTYRTRHKEYRGKLTTLTNGSYVDYVYESPDHLKYYFNDPTYAEFPWEEQRKGRLYRIEDYHNNRIQIQWNTFLGLVTKVIDTAGGEYVFEYYANNCLKRISLQQWTVNFIYTNNHLTSSYVTSPTGYSQLNTTRRFEYNNEGLLYRVYEPNSTQPSKEVTYDPHGRVIKVKDAEGNSARTRYDVPEPRQITRVDPNGFAWVDTYDRKHRLLTQKDPKGYENKFTYDESGNTLSVTDARGFTTYYTYDTRSNITSRTDSLGYTTQWQYHPTFNKAAKATDACGWVVNYTYDDATGSLVRQYDDLGEVASYTYYDSGLVKTAKDANGNTMSFVYDPNGFLVHMTDPNGYITRYSYNELGWKSTETNPLNEATSFSYDISGHIVQTVDANSRIFISRYDERGNLVEQIDPKGNHTYQHFNHNDQLERTTNALGSEYRYYYSPLGKVTRIIDPNGNEICNSYDECGYLVSIQDPCGFTISMEYDPSGNEIARCDQLGYRWTKKYDALNRTISQSDPLGNTVRTMYDRVGRIKQVTSAKGYSSTSHYDGRGRLVKWVDPQGRDWSYTYDQNMNITDIKDAKGGHYVMSYGPRNERLLERDQDGDEWHYTYDALNRLKTSKTPDGVNCTYAYDPAGRMRNITYSTGRSDMLDYDLNSNIRSASRSGGLNPATVTTNFTYDSVNRMISSTDCHGFTVGYRYDELNRLVGLTYPEDKTVNYRYDRLSRLVGHTDWADRVMEYSYDKTGRLISKRYPNGVEQAVQYDDSGRLTNLSYRKAAATDPFLAYNYVYDKNGNIAGSQSRGLPSVCAPAAFGASFQHTPANKMIDKQDVADASNSFAYTYDDNGNLVEASSPAQSYTLTYDEDNRTKLITWRKDAATVSILSKYDTAGRRVSRTRDSTETRFVLDMTGSYEKVLCDADGGNNIQKYYVYAGGVLAYSVNTAANTISYHSDASGNVATLTDGSQNAVAQYVYSPYGLILAETSSVSNPYKFAGSVGIMEELPGLYFMRARYYLADACRFLSTDPVRNIGPGWKPSLYEYASSNPLSNMDPEGESYLSIVAALYTAADALYQVYEYYEYEEEPDFRGALGAFAMAGMRMRDYGALAGATVVIDWNNKDHLAGEVRREFEYVGKATMDAVNRGIQYTKDFIDLGKQTGIDSIRGLGKPESKTENVFWKMFSANKHAENANPNELVSTRVEEPKVIRGFTGGNYSTETRQYRYADGIDSGRYRGPAGEARRWRDRLAERRNARRAR